jgi:hypothetical protein
MRAYRPHPLHYFADRGQVDTELVNRHVAALDERFIARLNDPTVKPWPAASMR